MGLRVVAVLTVVAGLALAGCGSSGSPQSLKPAALGKGQCQAAGLADGSGYGQIAVSKATCGDVADVAPGAVAANGTAYSSNGYSCTATAQGPGSASASSWGGTYYAYSCKDGGDQLAFNWGLNYIYGEAVPAAAGASSTLEPAALGHGQCQAGELAGNSTYAQIAVANAACSTAADLAAEAATAQGAAFQWNGFSCTGTSEGAGSTWAAAWAGTYDAYGCQDGTEQVAFTWGTRYIYR